MKYNKLVRDKIPQIIMADNKKPITHIAGDEEYWRKLKEKLYEEVDEFTKNDKPEEIADIMEVIEAIINYLNLKLIKKTICLSLLNRE